MSLPKNLMRTVKVSVPASRATLSKAVSALRAGGYSIEDGPIGEQAVFELLGDLVYAMNGSIATVAGYEEDAEIQDMMLGAGKWGEAESLLWGAVFKALALYKKK